MRKLLSSRRRVLVVTLVLLLLLDFGRSIYARVGYSQPFENWQPDPMVYAEITWPPGADLPVDTPTGKRVFAQRCAVCHGHQGKADGELSQPGMLVDDWGDPIKPAHLSLPAGAPGGVKLGHGGPRLYQTIVTGIGATPMPPFDSLTEEEVWDLVHYVQALRVTAHEAELASAGLQEQDRQTARERIWAAMSGPTAAERAVTADTGGAMASGLAQH